MPETRRKYDPEFREGAVRIARETGKPIAQLAGISGSTREPWVTGWIGSGSSAARRTACAPVGAGKRRAADGA
jgi:transposase-like protein